MKTVDEIIRREGGYVTPLNDRGEPTKFGVSIGQPNSSPENAGR